MSDHTQHPPGEHEAEHPLHNGREPRQAGFWKSPTGLVTIAFLAIGAFFLVTEHRAHLFGWLPWLLLLACPLLHIFMHGGHGGDGGHGGHGGHGDAGNSPSDGGRARPHQH